jgi:hypothetical protein
MRASPMTVTLVAALTLGGCSEAPKGEKGDAGEKGEAGPAGPPGPCWASGFERNSHSVRGHKGGM